MKMEILSHMSTFTFKTLGTFDAHGQINFIESNNSDKWLITTSFISICYFFLSIRPKREWFIKGNLGRITTDKINWL